MVVTTSGVLCQQLKLDENFQERRTAFLGFQLLPEQGQLWAVCAGYDDVYIWALGDLGRPPQRLRLQDCAEVRCMIRVKKQVRPAARAARQTGMNPAPRKPAGGGGAPSRACATSSPWRTPVC